MPLALAVAGSGSEASEETPFTSPLLTFSERAVVESCVEASPVRFSGAESVESETTVLLTCPEWSVTTADGAALGELISALFSRLVATLGESDMTSVRVTLRRERGSERG